MKIYKRGKCLWEHFSEASIASKTEKLNQITAICCTSFRIWHWLEAWSSERSLMNCTISFCFFWVCMCTDLAAYMRRVVKRMMEMLMTPMPKYIIIYVTLNCWSVFRDLTPEQYELSRLRSSFRFIPDDSPYNWGVIFIH